MTYKIQFLLLALSFFIIFSLGADPFREMSLTPREENYSFDKSFEPVISRNEADILNKVIQLTSESPQKAFEYLKPEISSEADPALLFALGNLCFQTDRPKEAETYYLQAISKFPEFLRARLNLARIYVRSNQPENALTQLQFILSRQQNNPALNLAGYIFLLKEDSMMAENYYRAALLSDPFSLNSRIGLIKALILSERYTEAKILIEETLRRHPDHTGLSELLANLCMTLKDYTGALKSLELLSLIQKPSPACLSDMAELYAFLELDEEAFTLYTILSSDPTRSVKILKAAEFFLSRKEYSYVRSLIPSLEKNSRNFKENNKDRLILLKAKLFQEENENLKATELFQQFLKNNPCHQEALLSMAHLKESLKKTAEAQILYERASKIKGENRYSILLETAQFFIRNENYSKALLILEEAQNLKPQASIRKYIEHLKTFLN